MLEKLWEYRKVRFLCVGTINSVVDLTILNILVFKFHFPIWLGNTISISIAVTMSYFLNHKIVFRHHNKPNFKQYIKFFLVTGISVILLQTVVIYLTKSMYLSVVRDLLNAHTYDKEIALNVAKITAVLIGMVWNFFFYSRFVFKNDPELNEEERSISLI